VVLQDYGLIVLLAKDCGTEHEKHEENQGTAGGHGHSQWQLQGTGIILSSFSQAP